MSNIEKYREQSNTTDMIITNLNKADSIGFYRSEIVDSDIPLYFHTSYSQYSICSPKLQPYLIKALNYYKEEIINFIIEQAEHDKRLALLDCKEEAEKILAEISEEMIK